MSEVVVTGDTLTLRHVAQVARQGARVCLSLEAEQRIVASERRLRARVADGHAVYGLTTGVGALDACTVTPEANRLRQNALLRSHAAGIGEPMADGEVRAMMLARINTFAGGKSGVRPSVVAGAVALLNAGVVPRVPRLGSIGASDLAPLAHAALVLVGEGHASIRGRPMGAAEALRQVGLAPVDLELRDAFALINGPAQSAGVGALAVLDAERLVHTAEVATAMTMTALSSRRDILDARLINLRPHPGTVNSAARLRALTGLDDGAAPNTLTTSTTTETGPIREALSTRCAPQVLGAFRDAVTRAESMVVVELNACVDNPVVLEDGWSTNSSGHPDSQHLAEALDALAMSVASTAVMSERRTARMLDPHHNGGLPAFLVHPHAPSGSNSGLMIAQYTAAAVVAELRLSIAPASVQSIPVCANSEDHCSMSALSAMRLARAIGLAEMVVAIELLTAAQGIDVSGRAIPLALRPYHSKLRTRVAVMVEDRIIGDDIATLLALIRDEVWSGSETRQDA